MDRFVELYYCGKQMLGIESIAQNNKGIVVLLLHGIPGDRVDTRRINVKIARHLEKIGISSVRFDFIASGVSEGEYIDVTYENIKNQINLITEFLISQGAKKIYLLGFSEVAKIILDYIKDNESISDVILCNGILSNSEYKQYSIKKKLKRINNQLAIDSGYGVWLNIDLLREKFSYDFSKILESHKVHMIYGTDDILTKESIKFCETKNCQMYYVKNADHLFTKHKWENELLEIISNIMKKCANNKI